MPGKKLAWMFFPAYLAITASALLVVALYASGSVQRFHVGQTAQTLEIRARLLGRELHEVLREGGRDAVDRACRERGLEIATRITVVLPGGQVAGDSEQSPSVMDNHASRPEVAEALAGRVGSATRRSPTLDREMMYVAVPLVEGGRVIAAVRTAIPLDKTEGLLASFYVHLALVGAAAAALAAIAGVVVFRRISVPLADLKAGAERFASGDLGSKMALPDAAEMRDLAKAVNQMAAQLDDRLRTVLRQRTEQEAVLMSMVEGVMAVDSDERVLSLNSAAARMLGLAGESFRGMAIQEVVRNTDLQRFVASALASSDSVEGSVVLRHGGGERHMEARGAMLRDAGGSRIGAVVVLHDVSRLRKLENMRREFVANVSHELKTPITSIKGYVETLADGSVSDPAEAGRFLGIVARHADRLNTIIEDLLLLSKLDQDPGSADLGKEETSVRSVLDRAAEACASRARERGIAVSMECPAGLAAAINGDLMIQAVTNLLDNAIKYSEGGGNVRVAASLKGGFAAISVEDQGCGIPAEHLPRIGERFYRVDRARSRSQGGTGLGLAIAKHIAEAHGGSLSVESEVGKGSTFTIRFPVQGGSNPAGGACTAG